jgi:hypothetical protein
LVLKLLADIAQALVHFILAGAHVLNKSDNEPDCPDEDQDGNDGSEDGESRHFVFSLEKWKSGSDIQSLPDSGNVLIGLI